MSDLTLLVLAKEPVPGRVKTRLTPTVSPFDAAALAAAALADTLAVVAAVDATRRVLVLDGRPGTWLPDGFEVVPQVSGGLDLRLAAAFAGVRGPAFLVGMDTPQLVTDDFDQAVAGLAGPADAVIGMCEDGGFWGIGMGVSCPQVFPGVPMSTDQTGRVQRQRLLDAGFTITDLAVRRDVDTIADARQVAGFAPRTRFAEAYQRLGMG